MVHLINKGFWFVNIDPLRMRHNDDDNDDKDANDDNDNDDNDDNDNDDNDDVLPILAFHEFYAKKFLMGSLGHWISADAKSK